MTISQTLQTGRSSLVRGGGLPTSGLGLPSQDTQVAAAYDRVMQAVDAAAGHLQRTVMHDGGHLEQAATDLETSPSPRGLPPRGVGEDGRPVLGRAEPHGPGQRLDVDRGELPQAAPHEQGPALDVDRGELPQAAPHEQGPALDVDRGELPQAAPHERGPALDTDSPDLPQAEPHQRGPSLDGDSPGASA
ncbi:hypothetical protein [Serinicoccus marinus]|uniref:hypothetical protein n=1 Tax=Serinicoccus marinus TaxID=247333 RepID=UPI0012FCA858|nr:hypothetical protein [Serinicoccus marinus]